MSLLNRIFSGLEMTDANTKATQRLGTAIKKCRKNLNITQTELADLAGVSLNYVSQLENGKTTIRFDKLLDVLDILGLELKLAPGNSRLSLKCLKG